MHQMNEIKENKLVEDLVRSFPRSLAQLNKLHESDAELFRMPGGDMLIAVTTDSICEEIELGIYTDPYLIGYMLVTINISDLAAVGAKPFGLTLNQTFTRDCSSDYVSRMGKGITDACNTYSVSILGGDTNFSSQIQMGATAIGYIPSGSHLTRKGCRAGDKMFTSGYLGNGNAYAFEKLINTGSSASHSRPLARVEEGAIVSQYASSCIDTSDGFFAAIDQLMRINNIGFKINAPISGYLAESSAQLCRQNSLPPWFMFAGPHGEFELLFTIPSEKVDAFILHAHSVAWKPILLGTAVQEPSISINYRNSVRQFDTGYIRNLFYGETRDLKYYISELMKIEHTFSGGLP